MSIGISDEHVELASSLRKWAADLRGRDLARAAEDDPAATFEAAWAALTEMGVPAIGLPETAGGGGGTTLDVAVALEACAHELVPGPLLGPVVAASVLGAVPDGAVVG
ncbi:acyl-CoA dehydrogenase family protein, partial [Nocardioides sp.]|uniref:acyl-CoA dehydrogenase family protein n=1 Tax=Nocardioides sp. TaxID=35761 RepID=UPI002ED81606